MTKWKYFRRCPPLVEDDYLVALLPPGMEDLSGVHAQKWRQSKGCSIAHWDGANWWGLQPGTRNYGRVIVTHYAKRPKVPMIPGHLL